MRAALLASAALLCLSSLLLLCLVDALSLALGSSSAAASSALRGGRAGSGSRSERRVAIRGDFELPVAQIPDTFLSITFDSEQVSRIDTYHWDSSRLVAFARELSPGYFRIGGTNADSMSIAFPGAGAIPTPPSPKKRKSNQPAQPVLTSTQLLRVGEFAHKANLGIIFGLNGNMRVEEHKACHHKSSCDHTQSSPPWDSAQAEAFVKWAASVPHTSFPLKVLELGNEPDFYSQTRNSAGHIPWIRPAQQVQNHEQLTQIMEQNGLHGVQLWGPDTKLFWEHTGSTAKQRRYNSDFFKALASSKVQLDTFGVHHYYFAPPTPKSGITKASIIAGMLRPSSYNDLHSKMQKLEAAARRNGWHDMRKLALSETSSITKGGSEGLSDAFGAGFLFLDKLGLTARHGWGHVLRQTFLSDPSAKRYPLHYGLIDSNMHANPDYFTAVLHKRLVGQTVLATAMPGGKETTRVYAHCTNNRRSPSLPRGAAAGSVTLIFLNLSPREFVSLQLSPHLMDWGAHRMEFILTSEASHGGLNAAMTSRVVRLNGKVLHTAPDGTACAFPCLPGKSVPNTGSVLLPPLSYGFLVFPAATARACHGSGAKGKPTPGGARMRTAARRRGGSARRAGASKKNKGKGQKKGASARAGSVHRLRPGRPAAHDHASSKRGAARRGRRSRL